MDRVIITCAVCGSRTPDPAHESFPRTPTAIAADAIAAARSGAAIVHLHARDSTGRNTRETQYFETIVNAIQRSGVDVIINLTAGGGARFYPSADDESRADPRSDIAAATERLTHVLALRPEICSLDVTTHARAGADGDYVYMNTPRTLRAMAATLMDAGVKPELEVFHPGDLMLARQMIDEGLVAGVPWIQFVLGIRWATPADPAGLQYLHSLLPRSCLWGAMGTGSRQFSMVALSAMLGGHVRVGLEDNAMLEPGRFATNVELVERAVQLVRWMGREPATPAEARQMLGLVRRPSRQVLGLVRNSI